jgi:acetylornithine deacetylase/succinyl-diaminopimelate desuccinylase-like protein
MPSMSSLVSRSGRCAAPLVLAALLGSWLGTPAEAEAAPPGEQRPSPVEKAPLPHVKTALAPSADNFEKLGREIYRELVEINTTPSVGDTYAAARAMAARLRAAGFPAADVQVFQTAPKRGNLVARLRGTGKARPILLLAHTDVVEARREDWSSDPFELVEQDGYFYARGSGDDKYMAATFILNLLRYRREGYRPDRDIIVALTTDEEIGDRQQLGIRWLLDKHRELIDAELALNEGGGVGVKEGRPLWNSVQTTEKLYQNFWLSVKNSGGHSSQPRADNAIYTLSQGLVRLAAHRFPVELNATTRTYFERMASLEQGQLKADLRAVLGPKPDPAVLSRLSAKPPYNAQLRTTCVATLLEGGHAENALPQLARALVNCRILPGHGVEETQRALVAALKDDQIAVVPDKLDTPSDPSPLEPELMATIERVTAKFWPGIPVLPTLSAGATDSRFLRNAGIPAYGHSGLASDIFDVRAHGKDERVSVAAFVTGQRYLYELVKQLATTTP